jgi:imidazolonepropionase-like amidohydrolase
LRTLWQQHVRIAIGSDNYRETPVPEAMYLQALGVFSNLEMLTMWSVTTPKAIFPGRRIGELRPGFEATFLALESDPLLDFEATQRISLRVKEGRVLRTQNHVSPSGASDGRRGNGNRPGTSAG